MQKKPQTNITFQLHALHKDRFRKKKRKNEMIFHIFGSDFKILPH